MDDTVKKIVLTGAAADSLSPSSHHGGAPVKRKSTSRKKRGGDSPIVTKMDEGGGVSPGTFDQLSSTRAPGPPLVTQNNAVKLIPALGARQPILIGGTTATAVPAAQRVILAKSSKTKKVFLAAAPNKVKDDSTSAPTKKRKTMKRIRISIGGTHVKKAKTIKHKSSNKTIAEVKTALTKAGLIKEDTKAPEDVLRQMYSDFMVLKKRAL